VVTVVPSSRTSRAGRFISVSQPTADAPRTMQAVLTMLASRARPAATLTVRQMDLAGFPVAGSMMWCSFRPWLSQARTVVLDVASPPALMATVWPGASGPAAWSSVTRTRQPPAGASPATAMSPPRLTSTAQSSRSAITSAQRSAAQALAVAPRSSWAPPVSVTRGGSVLSSTLRQPGTRPAGASRPPAPGPGTPGPGTLPGPLPGPAAVPRLPLLARFLTSSKSRS
jgi:hypothetical protein